MDKLTITGVKDAFMIQIDGQHFEIPKDHTSLMWTKLLYPTIERSQSTQAKMQHLMKEQYYQSMDQSKRIEQMIKKLRQSEQTEHLTELQNIFDLNRRWQYFIHEIYRLYDVELPKSKF